MNIKPKKISTRLWAENRDLAEASLRSTFVRGLSSGKLPRHSFRRYVAQDAFFLEAFARAYALACARAPDGAGLRAFATLLQGVTEELKLHAAYAARLRIPLNKIRPHPATRAYASFLADVARTGRMGEICAAMTPCMRLYAYLGKRLAAENGARRHVYTKWITTYSEPAFQRLSSTLEKLLDRYAGREPAVWKHYRRAMELELAFFNAHA